MIRTMPFRRTILQFSQIRLTLARTFMIHAHLRPLDQNGPSSGESVFIAQTRVPGKPPGPGPVVTKDWALGHP
jgi:hypothetical protein